MMFPRIVTQTKTALIFLVSLLLCGPVMAKNFRDLYNDEALIRVQQVYGENIRAVLYEDIAKYLTADEIRSLRTVDLYIPLRTPSGGLFDFSMGLDSAVLTASALSIKFLDDIAIALSWYEINGLDSKKVALYVARLYNDAEYLEAPLPALNVPDKAWAINADVDDMSQKLLKSAIAFLLLHELGHWHHQHKPYTAISQRRAQTQEIESDALAIEVMGRMSTPPYGIVTWFMVTGLMAPDNPTTHPLSSTRLQSIAVALEETPERFISRDNRHTLSRAGILELAKNIRVIAEALE
jgi:hypothetical protein